MKPTILILAVALLAGCKTAAPVGGALGVGADIAHAQEKADVLHHGLEQLTPYVNATGTPLFDSLLWISTSLSRTEMPLLGERFNKYVESVGELTVERNRLKDHYENDLFSQRQKRWAWLIFGVWAGLGVLGIVSGYAGWTGVSSLVMRALPFANVFAWIRDMLAGTRRKTVKR